MNPKIPDILSRVLGVSERTLDRPSGDARRVDEIEKLFEEANAAAEWPTDQPRRFVNDWTLMLLKMLRKIERAGPYGDAGELIRASTVGLALVPYVQGDALEAMRVAARRGSTSDHDFKNKTAGRES